METLASTYIPTLRTDADGMTSSVLIWIPDCGFWYCRRFDEHHSTSVFAEFNWSLVSSLVMCYTLRANYVTWMKMMMMINQTYTTELHLHHFARFKKWKNGRIQLFCSNLAITKITFMQRLDFWWNNICSLRLLHTQKQLHNWYNHNI